MWSTGCHQHTYQCLKPSPKYWHTWGASWLLVSRSTPPTSEGWRHWLRCGTAFLYCCICWRIFGFFWTHSLEMTPHLQIVTGELFPTSYRYSYPLKKTYSFVGFSTIGSSEVATTPRTLSQSRGGVRMTGIRINSSAGLQSLLPNSIWSLLVSQRNLRQRLCVVVGHRLVGDIISHVWHVRLIDLLSWMTGPLVVGCRRALGLGVGYVLE